MFIIWKGYGFLVPFIAVAIVGVVSVVFWSLFPKTVFIGPCLGCFLAAAAIWIIGNKFNSPAKNRVLIDKQTGQEILFKPDHSLFFIKMQYWAFLVGVAGVVILLAMIFAK